MKRALGACVAQYTSPQPTSAQFIRDLDAAVALGMWGVRLDIVPCYTANGKDLSEVAAKITAARARGLHVHAMLPHWTSDDKVQHKDVHTLALLGAFAGTVGVELGSEISTYELGNEPDITTFAPDGADPAFQAAVTAAMVKQLPAGAHIVSPGLAPAADTFKAGKPQNMSPVTFSRLYWAALDTATKARIAGQGIHLYGTPKDIGQSWSTYHQLGAISTNGGGRPLEVTESNGYATASPADKATQYAAALDWLAATSIRIGRVFFYELSTQGSEPSYGAYDAKGKPQPLLSVLQHYRSRANAHMIGSSTATVVNDNGTLLLFNANGGGTDDSPRSPGVFTRWYSSSCFPGNCTIDGTWGWELEPD